MLEMPIKRCNASVMIVGLNYAPEEIGIGPYTAGLAEGLANRGMQVRVIAGRPYYPRWTPLEGSKPYWQRRREGDVLVTRSPHYIPAKPTGRNRILHHLSFAASAFFPAVLSALRRRPRVVLAVAPSFLSVPLAWLSARLAGAQLWLHIQDFELEAAFATGLLDPRRRRSRLARVLENWILNHADVVSSISPQMCAKLLSRGIPAEKIYELRNWANHFEEFEKPHLGNFRQEWNLGARKIALYSGNIANKQGLEVVIEAARALRERDDLVFVICGDGPNRERLEMQALGLDNVVFRDLQPASRIAELLSLAHVHLLPQLADAADLVLPSKLTNMLASGRPVVATAAQGTGLYDEVDGCGISVAPGDGAAMAAAIRALANDLALADEYGAHGRQRAIDRWSQQQIVDLFAARICDMSERKTAVPAE